MTTTEWGNLSNSKTAVLINRLKEDWISGFAACELILSNSGDRCIRHIRQKQTPAGYKMEERWNKSPEGHRYKEFRLVLEEAA